MAKQLAVAESKLENANTLNSELKEETRKLKQEIDQLRRVNVEQTKKIAQLEAQVDRRKPQRVIIEKITNSFLGDRDRR